MLQRKGMMVRETKRDASTVSITAIGSERMKSPEPSGRLAKGRNDNKRVAVHPNMATTMCEVAETAAALALMPPHVSFNIFYNNYRIINQQAESDDHTYNAQLVEGITHQIQHKKSYAQRQWYRDHDDQRSPGTQRQQGKQNKKNGNCKIFSQSGQPILDTYFLIKSLFNLNAGRQTFSKLVSTSANEARRSIIFLLSFMAVITHTAL